MARRPSGCWVKHVFIFVAVSHRYPDWLPTKSVYLVLMSNKLFIMLLVSAYVMLMVEANWN